MKRAFDLSVYVVTDRTLCGPRGVVETVREAIAGGATLVQLRDPEARTGALVDDARALVELLRPAGIPLLVNDRVDVALAAGADGVHVGQSDMRPADARALLGPDLVLGLSITCAADLARSDLTGVDYLGVGPVYATPTKPDAAPPLGVGGLRVIRGLTRLPIVAIGGLHAGNAAEVVTAGADGVAVVSAICGSPDPRVAARELAGIVAGAKAGRRSRGASSQKA